MDFEHGVYRLLMSPGNNGLMDDIIGSRVPSNGLADRLRFALVRGNLVGVESVQGTVQSPGIAARAVDRRA